MTTVGHRPARSKRRPRHVETLGQLIVRYLTATDHKVISNLYPLASFGFFLADGLMAMVIRSELAQQRPSPAGLVVALTAE